MQENSENKKKSLFEYWKEQWENGIMEEELKVFFELFQEVYRFVKQKNEENKKRNYRCKYIFFIVFIAGFVIYIIFLLYSLYKKQGSFVNLGFVLMAFIWLETIISKWLDIKKYQETWARHSWHLHMMKREMLYFVSQIKPYGAGDDRRIFVKRIIAIWDKNQEKFVYNMEEKEKGLMDVFENMKLG